MPEPLPSNAEDDDQALLTFAATRDLSCPACGYNLRMLSKPFCPECGLPLRLTVGSNEPFRRAWAIALCLNAMIGGAGLFFLIIFVSQSGPPLAFEHLWYYLPMPWIVVPVVLLFLRKRFCRWDRPTQYAIVGASIFVIVVLIISLLNAMN